MEYYTMSHQTKQISLCMVSNGQYVCTFVRILFVGPPTVKPITIGIQEVLPISSVYYLIDGDHIQLNCLATNDPQSPDELNFIWYKDSTIVDSQGLRRVTGKSSNGQSFILFYNLDMSQDNGTYTCSVKNFELGRAITQSAVVIIEST